MSLFEAFYNWVFQLIYSDVTGYNDRQHADVTEDKFLTMYMYRFILNAYMIYGTNEHLNEKVV